MGKERRLAEAHTLPARRLCSGEFKRTRNINVRCAISTLSLRSPVTQKLSVQVFIRHYQPCFCGCFIWEVEGARDRKCGRVWNSLNQRDKRSPRKEESQARSGNTQDRPLGALLASKRKARTQEAPARTWETSVLHKCYLSLVRPLDCKLP